MKLTSNMRRQLDITFEILLLSKKSHTKHVGKPQFAHHWYKPGAPNLWYAYHQW